MILAGKILCLFLVFMFTPAMLIGGIRGNGFPAANAFLVAVGSAGFIALQWLL